MRQIDFGVSHVSDMIFEMLVISFKSHHPQNCQYSEFYGGYTVMGVMMHRRLEMIDGSASFKKGERANKIAMDDDYLFYDDVTTNVN